MADDFHSMIVGKEVTTVLYWIRAGDHHGWLSGSGDRLLSDGLLGLGLGRAQAGVGAGSLVVVLKTEP